MQRRVILLLVLSLLTTATYVRAQDATDLDEQQLRRAAMATDTESLLAFLRQRSVDKPDPAQIPLLITQLSAKEFKVRDDAAKALRASGPAALPALQKAGASEDVEVRQRAQQCIQAIKAAEEDRQTRWSLHMPVVRLLVKRRPPQALATLLQYLPHAMGEEVTEEVWYGLDALAGQDGKLDDRLVAALKDKAPERRAVAACIVARRGTPEQRAVVRQLLTDKSAEVRLRAVQGMLAAGEKEGLPVLIPLLEEAPIDLAWQAEELLHWAAGRTSPQTVLGAGKPEERKTCRQAWEKWLRSGPTDLRERLSSPGPGLVLSTCRPVGEQNHKFFETYQLVIYGRDGTARWQSVLLPGLRDAQLLPGGRFLVAEHSKLTSRDGPPYDKVENPTGGVAERDPSGKVLWQTKGDPNILKFPWRCERLGNGNNWITTRQGQMAEIDPDSGVVASHGSQGGFTASYEKNGSRVFLMLGEMCTRTSYGTFLCRSNIKDEPVFVEFHFENERGPIISTDSNYKKKSFGLKITTVLPMPKELRPTSTELEPVPGGNFLLIAPPRLDKINNTVRGGVRRILEYDRKGAVVWEKEADASSVTRLRNGMTLASILTDPEQSTLVEFDRDGKTTWKISVASTPKRVRPCLNLVRFGFSAGEGW